MSRHRRPRRTVFRVAAQFVVVLALIAGVVGLAVKGFDRSELVPNPPTAVGNAAPEREPFFETRPALLVVTDSMGGGVGDPNITKNYPQYLAEKMGWDVNVDGVGATGYVETHLTMELDKVDRTVPPVIDRLDIDAKNYRADYIVVDVGRNDFRKDPRVVAPAIDDYLTQLRSRYPGAQIMVIAPLYISTFIPMQHYALADQIRQSAEKIGAHVLDPVAEGWWTGVDLPALWWTDGIHLNTPGAQYYAEKIAEGMRRVGIAGNTESPQGAAP